MIHFLLSTEIIPLCLRIMETGSELSKTVAIFIVQKILLDESRTMQDEVITTVRKENADALESLKQKGLIVVPTPDAMVQQMAKLTAPIALRETGNFSKEFQDEVGKLLEEYKTAHPNERGYLEGKK